LDITDNNFYTSINSFGVEGPSYLLIFPFISMVCRSFYNINVTQFHTQCVVHRTSQLFIASELVFTLYELFAGLHSGKRQKQEIYTHPGVAKAFY
jgi:hypothetical protein